MAAIAPGSGGTLKSTTAESALVEAILFLVQCERDSAKNPNGYRSLNYAVTDSGAVFSGDFSLSATQTLTGTGSLAIAANPYLTATGFSPGSGGTFKSTTIEATVLEILMFLQLLETDATKNTNNRNFVTGTYNSDTRIYRGTFSLPVAMTIGPNGEAIVTANEYLQT